MKELRACRKCGRVTTELKCPDPQCGGETTLEWDGYIYIIRPELSSLAKKIGKTTEGEYAIKTR
ncbi:MAG: transcription elongation factor subunit Spt4 [Thermoplasmata archaeon]|jgi:DNA-directed RNA polymerase subunit E"|nr:DNA-directed RNA polymerase subunit E'' [Thermoplasmatales archaeon]PMP75134.1 MAG: DNA-directed RNA polymerase subunit E'' [Aciduliprofundum sp.]HEU13079.1 DNA-directed RNA polymerase subunit E'' [Euryarchaeota archaeon]